VKPISPFGPVEPVYPVFELLICESIIACVIIFASFCATLFALTKAIEYASKKASS
jgi:hypothetical protein